MRNLKERKAEDKTWKGTEDQKNQSLAQKIVAEWWNWVGEKTKTGDNYGTA